MNSPARPRRRNDRRDVDAWELKLLRAGHHVWSLYRREKRELGGYLNESGPLWEALQTIWKAKQDYRAELAARRKAKAGALLERLKELSGKRARTAGQDLGDEGLRVVTPNLE